MLVNNWSGGESSPANAKAFPVRSDEASETERFAAQELQTYLQKISGAKLPIVSEPEARRAPRVFIGTTSRAGAALAYLKDSAPESFLVWTVNDDLLLVGDACGKRREEN